MFPSVQWCTEQGVTGRRYAIPLRVVELQCDVMLAEGGKDIKCTFIKIYYIFHVINVLHQFTSSIEY